MNAKDISRKTIEANRFTVGKSVKGKGLEIYPYDTNVFYAYGELNEKDFEKFEALKEYDFKKLYVESYYEDEKWIGDKTFNPNVSFEIFYNKVLKEPQRFSSIRVNKIGEKIGYISLSKYKSDRQSQIELCEDLLKLQGLTIRGEVYELYYDIEYDDEIFNFKSHGDYYCKGDYLLEHGSNICESTSDSIYFDGRMSNFSESEMNIFEFDECKYLKEIDPEESISVYHRKGKDWYIGYALQDKEMNIYFKAVELCFEDVDDLKELIYNSIEWNFETIKSDFSKAYNDALYERLKVDDNYMVAVETYSRFKDCSYTTYNHLAKLKRLENKFNFELVKSAISENHSMVSWAIKRDNEEYHFNLASLIAHDVDGEYSVKEFLVNALAMLEKRRLEKIEESELYEKASKVFIGIQDSLSSGNCQLGTNQFVRKHNININKIGGIRGDVLLELEKSNFTLRAVAYAISKHAVAA